MYISAKTNETTRKFFQTLLELNISTEARERPVITFIEAKLEEAGYQAYVSCSRKELVIIHREYSNKIASMKLDNLDAIFNL